MHFVIGVPSIVGKDLVSPVMVPVGQRPQRICFEMDGAPEPSFLMLKKDGIEVEKSQYRLRAGCIRLKQVSYDDTGSYDVVVSNCFGRAELGFNMTVNGNGHCVCVCVCLFNSWLFCTHVVCLFVYWSSALCVHLVAGKA